MAEEIKNNKAHRRHEENNFTIDQVLDTLKQRFATYS